MRRFDLSFLLTTSIAAAALGLASPVSAQQSYTGAPITYDFTGYTGLGLQPTPLVTQLDSDEIQVIANSTTSCLFGATCTTAGTFARGPSAGGVTSSGLYAFTVAAGNVAFGVQPASTTFGGPSTTSTSAGSIWLRFVNGTGGTLGTVLFSDHTWVLNNDANTSQITTFFTNGTTAAATRVAVTMQATPIVADAAPAWTTTAFAGAFDLSSLAVPAGGTFYLVVAINDATGGSGARDEIALDDIRIERACGNGVVDPGEACDAGAANGTTTCGCQSACTFGASGTSCAPSTGGLCDLADTCDGAGSCANRFVAAGTTCRAATDVCDAAETCSGSSAACPVDANLATGTTCRPAAAGSCDRAETCTGGPACPADTFQPAGTVCAASSGAACDVDDVCSGTSTTCAPRVAVAGTACRAASGVCDAADSCDGTATTCADGHATDGTACADALACNGGETCLAGACAAAAPITCDDTDACTSDSCGEPSGTCMHATIADCCNDAGDCDDGDACTADDCTGAGATCTHDPIAGCGDAGTVEDAGITEDAGATEDAGTTDAGTAGDAGSMRDAGSTGDAAAASDASRLDGASAADAGTTTMTAGGCACSAAGTRHGAGASMLGLGLALAVIARRRRR